MKNAKRLLALVLSLSMVLSLCIVSSLFSVVSVSAEDAPTIGTSEDLNTDFGYSQVPIEVKPSEVNSAGDDGKAYYPMKKAEEPYTTAVNPYVSKVEYDESKGGKIEFDSETGIYTLINTLIPGQTTNTATNTCKRSQYYNYIQLLDPATVGSLSELGGIIELEFDVKLIGFDGTGSTSNNCRLNLLGLPRIHGGGNEYNSANLIVNNITYFLTDDANNQQRYELFNTVRYDTNWVTFRLRLNTDEGANGVWYTYVTSENGETYQTKRESAGFYNGGYDEADHQLETEFITAQHGIVLGLYNDRCTEGDGFELKNFMVKRYEKNFGIDSVKVGETEVTKNRIAPETDNVTVCFTREFLDYLTKDDVSLLHNGKAVALEDSDVAIVGKNITVKMPAELKDGDSVRIQAGDYGTNLKVWGKIITDGFGDLEEQGYRKVRLKVTPNNQLDSEIHSDANGVEYALYPEGVSTPETLNPFKDGVFVGSEYIRKKGRMLYSNITWNEGENAVEVSSNDKVLNGYGGIAYDYISFADTKDDALNLKKNDGIVEIKFSMKLINTDDSRTAIMGVPAWRTEENNINHQSFIYKNLEYFTNADTGANNDVTGYGMDMAKWTNFVMRADFENYKWYVTMTNSGVTETFDMEMKNYTFSDGYNKGDMIGISNINYAGKTGGFLIKDIEISKYEKAPKLVGFEVEESKANVAIANAVEGKLYIAAYTNNELVGISVVDVANGNSLKKDITIADGTVYKALYWDKAGKPFTVALEK